MHAQPGSTQLCDHAGVLLFAPELIALRGLLPDAQPYLTQWLAGLILGAVNIEQTKYLNFTDLEFLLGQSHCTLSQQLQRLASTPEIIPTLLRWNYAQLPPTEQASDDFYLDPHTKHYTDERATTTPARPATTSSTGKNNPGPKTPDSGRSKCEPSTPAAGSPM